MTNNNQSSNPHTSEPKYRKKLNTEQLDVLELLYRFRFASSKQIAVYQQKQASKAVSKRLKILEDQGLISKRYDKSYKLRGRPAAYYLPPAGARTLETTTERHPDEPINIKRIYKDKDVSENFIEHCSNILDVYLELGTLFPKKDTFTYATNSKLNCEKYDFFPSPRPDAYIRINKTTKNEKHFFLDIFEVTQPYFILVRRIKKYLKYSEDGDWSETDTDFPTILIACATASVQKRLRKRIAKELQDSYEEITFATTTIEALKDMAETNGKIWLPIDEDGDDPDEPQKPVGLRDL